MNDIPTFSIYIILKEISIDGKPIVLRVGKDFNSAQICNECKAIKNDGYFYQNDGKYFIDDDTEIGEYIWPEKISRITFKQNNSK